MTLDCTGERFLPWMDDKVISYEHYHRYIFALPLVNGKNVIDLACGEGYGSQMLARMAKSVVGIDIDKETIAHANKKYKSDNLTFIQGSILQIPFTEENKFDIVVCFEAIEHIENHKKMLSEVKRVLKKDGILIISTPDKRLYSDHDNYINPYHKKELYYEEFRELLKLYFSHFKIFGQNVYGSSNIWDLSPLIVPKVEEVIIDKHEDSIFLNMIKKKPRFFIGIASNEALIELSDSILTDISGISDSFILITHYNDLKRHSNNLEKIIINREDTISTLKNIIIERDKKIAEFEEISKSPYKIVKLWMRSKIY